MAKKPSNKRRKPTREEKLQHLTEAFKYVRQWRTAIDVGAFVGLWTQAMAARFARVHSFEPVAYLANTVRSRGLNNVTVHHHALGNRTGTFNLIGDKHSLQWLDFSQPGVNRDDVNECTVMRLDDLNIPDVDLIKVDAEGADLLVLKGGEETLRKYKPVIIMERKASFEDRYGITDDNINKFMNKLGYTLRESYWHDYIWSDTADTIYTNE